MIASLVAPELRTHGFRKRRNSFSRQTSDDWMLIDFQASQFGTREGVSFTINLGLNFVEFQAANEGPPSLGRAHVRQRIGRLLDAGSDVWWNLDSGSDFTAVAAQVNNAVLHVAIPWLEERAALADLLTAAQEDPSFVEPWHLARLTVLAERSGQPKLVAQLRQLSQREAS
jgi:hypothetical protein